MKAFLKLTRTTITKLIREINLIKIKLISRPNLTYNRILILKIILPVQIIAITILIISHPLNNTHVILINHSNHFNHNKINKINR